MKKPVILAIILAAIIITAGLVSFLQINVTANGITVGNNPFNPVSSAQNNNGTTNNGTTQNNQWTTPKPTATQKPTATATPHPSNDAPIPSEPTSGGVSWIQFTIHFSDGTDPIVIDQTKVALQSGGFWVVFGGNGHPIADIQIKTLAILNGEGGTFSSKVTQQIEAYKKPATIPKMSSTGTYTVNSGYWSDGETITLSDVTLYTQKANGPQPSIDSLIKTYGDGQWFFQVVSQVSKLQVTETNAGTVTYTAIQPAAGLDVTYSSNLATNIAATIDHTPIT